MGRRHQVITNAGTACADTASDNALPLVTIKRYIGTFRKPLRWRGWKRFVRYFMIPATAAAAVLLVTRGVFVTQLSLPADRNDLGLLAGDRLLVNRTAFGIRLPRFGTAGGHRIGHGQPRRGDIVVFDASDGSKGLLIGCINALPGDTIAGKPLPAETYRADSITLTHDRLRGRVILVSYSAAPDAALHRCLRRDRFFLLPQ